MREKKCSKRGPLGGVESCKWQRLITPERGSETGWIGQSKGATHFMGRGEAGAGECGRLRNERKDEGPSGRALCGVVEQNVK
jgi:hypothetical protein